MTAIPATGAGAFEAKYRDNPDPWNFAGSEYEQGRYRETLSALPRLRYEVGFEPGCSIGELTAKLAERCAKLIAVDVSPTAIERARKRCAGLGDVRLQVATTADFTPNEPLDLIVFSELGYYFDTQALGRYAHRLGCALQPGGDFIAVHWLGHSADHVLHGDDVHEQLQQSLALTWQFGSRHEGYRIDCWRRP